MSLMVNCLMGKEKYKNKLVLRVMTSFLYSLSKVSEAVEADGKDLWTQRKRRFLCSSCKWLFLELWFVLRSPFTRTFVPSNPSHHKRIQVRNSSSYVVVHKTPHYTTASSGWHRPASPRHYLDERLSPVTTASLGPGLEVYSKLLLFPGRLLSEVVVALL